MMTTKMLAIFMTLVTVSYANDAIFWNLESPAVLTLDLIKDASVQKPVLIFSLNSFDLMDFSKFANVYTLAQEKPNNENRIIKHMRSSLGYGSTNLAGDYTEFLPETQVLNYKDKADTNKLYDAKVILVHASNLKQIDAQVDDILSALHKRDYIVVITGQTSKIGHRIGKRAAPPTLSNATAQISYNDSTLGCAIFAQSVNLLIGDTKSGHNFILPLTIGKAVTCTVENSTKPVVSSTITIPISASKSDFFSATGGSITLTFAIYKFSMTWNLQVLDAKITGFMKGATAIPLNEIKLTYMGSSGKDRLGNFVVESVKGFNYACGMTSPEYFKLGDSVKDVTYVGLSFGNLQMEPIGFTGPKFSDNVDDCTGFFTIGIWMSLFTALLMLLILLCAITMLMNLKTMDRFDDPKQKPLIINVREG